MPINKNEITKEMVIEAMQCKSPKELKAYAESKGVDITEEEAKAYFAELEDIELDSETLKQVAGGDLFSYLRGAATTIHGTIKDICK